MFEENIFHPVSGEKGYFVSEEESKFIKALIADFRYCRLSTIENSVVVEGDVDD